MSCTRGSRSRSGSLRRPASRPGLATLLVGEDYPAQAYERRVRRLAGELDCLYVCEQHPSDVELADVLATLGKLNADPRITGILVLRPLPLQVPRDRSVPHPGPRQGHRGRHPRERGPPGAGAAQVHPVDAGILLPPAGCLRGLHRARIQREATTGSPSSWSGAPTTWASRPSGSACSATRP